MNCPCHECEFRRPGCHGSCELYKQWKAPAESMRKAKARQRLLDDMAQAGKGQHYIHRKREHE